MKLFGVFLQGITRRNIKAVFFRVPNNILDNSIEADPFIIAAVVLVVALNVVEQGFTGWVRAGCLPKVLLKRIVGELKRLLGSF